ncbi:MAG: F0F1 ATP synthase subunit epsilon [Phycisphaerales bacterium]
MAGTVRCKLITPEAALINDEVVYASVPLWDGLMGVQHGGAPMVAKLGLGELRLDFPDTPQAKGGSRSYFVKAGFMRLANNELTLLASAAVPVENLVETECEAALKEAETRVVPEGATDRLGEMDRITAERRSARTKLSLARRHRGKGI